ncbi:PspC domain-containing protein [Jiangella mangrovi]|uniref:Phage shock protein PspC (Stress-responsive transcriptional regulator) n=1 Tax=Jiangella mangrovi TaxID=1524084 RepID=A0A7W9GQM4_9ACTN|nr:PspC domain-containing protein [Jiangella mangrovi]MBB5788237.1 phage shock protein PspC (stress-responsive transcriptional regulator) [Jiangella mangrovi]
MSDLPPASAGTTPRVTDEFRSLRRSRSDRVVAGVLGGLGRRLGIDPVVLRVATVVLAIFGGVGVLLYAVAWLMVPAEDEERSVLDQALGRGEDRRSGTVPLALLLATVGLVSGIGIIAGTWDGGVLLLLAIMGVYLLLRRRDDEDERARADAPQEAWFDSPYVYDPTVAAQSRADAVGDTTATATGTADAATGTGTATKDSTATTPGPAGPTSGWPEGPDWGPPPAPPAPAPVPPPARPEKQRSVLGLITFCVAIVSVGVLAVNDAAWANYPPAIYIAVPLGIVALGLLVGAWYGRSRGLIFLGFLLSLALVPATWLSQWDLQDVGDATYTYTTAAAVPTEHRDHGVGDNVYDLSGLTLTDDQTVRLSVEQGVGELTILVPPNADVTVERASLGAGDMSILGESRDGAGQEFTDLTDNGPDGPGGGRIVLDLDMGLGSLEVNR